MQNLQTTAVDCWSIWTSALKYVLHVATCAETQAARCSWHCQSAADQSCPIPCYDFYKKCHNYVTVQRIFNRFCQHQITISWHIHLQIFAESFIKFVQKLWEIYRKTNVLLFFRTQCICIWITSIHQSHHAVIANSWGSITRKCCNHTKIYQSCSKYSIIFTPYCIHINTNPTTWQFAEPWSKQLCNMPGNMTAYTYNK